MRLVTNVHSDEAVPGAQIEIAPETDSYEADDDQWLAQVAAFYEGLRDRGISVREESKPAPGAKGDVSTIIVALGSAGAFTAAVAAFKDFLSRERTRRLRVRWTVGDQSREVVVTGDTDNATLERITQEAMRHSSED